MARILVGTNPVPGHTNPALPLVRELITRGHRVCWYTGEAFRASIEATGARFAPVRSTTDWSQVDVMEAIREIDPAMASAEGIAQVIFGMKHFFIDSGVGYYRDCLQLIEEFQPDIILSDSLFVPARLLHDRTGILFASFGESVLGVPSADTAPFGPAIPPDCSFLGQIRNRIMNVVAYRVLFREVNRYYNQKRRELGLPPTKQFFFESLQSPYLYMQSTVPSFEYPRRDLPPHFHFIGPLLPVPPAHWTPPGWWDDVKSGRPVVHVTQGTINNTPEDLILPTLQALADRDMLVIVTTGKNAEGYAAGLGPLPSNARVARYLPYAHLLPWVDIMITNGGYGGVQCALAHGIPLIVAGTTEDKAEVSARIAWSGVGINLKTKTATPDQVRTAVDRMLASDTYRQRARQVQREMAGYTAPTTAAQLLEQFAVMRQPIHRSYYIRPQAEVALTA